MFFVIVVSLITLFNINVKFSEIRKYVVNNVEHKNKDFVVEQGISSTIASDIDDVTNYNDITYYIEQSYGVDFYVFNIIIFLRYTKTILMMLQRKRIV